MKTANDAIDDFAAHLEIMGSETDGRLLFDMLRIAAERQGAALVAGKVKTLAEVQAAFIQSVQEVATPPKVAPVIVYGSGSDAVN